MQTLLAARRLSSIRASRLLGSLLLLPAFSFAQTTLDIDGVTRVSNGSGGYAYDTWKPLQGHWASPFTDSNNHTIDPIYDQQTGQPQADFVSVAGTPGFFVQFGQINGVDHLAFRILLNEYRTTGSIVNIRLGFDGNYDGKVDLYLGLNQQSNQYGLVFQSPGTDLNISPSTSDFGNSFYPTANRTGLPALNANNNALALTADNFSNIQLGDGIIDDGSGGQPVIPPDVRPTYYPGWTTAQEASASKVSLDAMISYAFPLADINAALASIGAGFTVTPDRLMLWVAVTATQDNAVNQDAYGTDKVGFDSNYTSFLNYMDAYGRPVPEPSAYGLLLGAGLGGTLLLRRRHRHPRAARPLFT